MPTTTQSTTTKPTTPSLLPYKLFYLLFFAAESTTPYLPLYFHHLHYPSSLIGLLLSLRRLTSTIISPLFTYTLSHLPNPHKKPFFIISITIYYVLTILLPFITGRLLVVVLVLVREVFVCGVDGCVNSEVMRVLGLRGYGEGFGGVRGWGAVGWGGNAVVCMWVVGWGSGGGRGEGDWRRVLWLQGVWGVGVGVLGGFVIGDGGGGDGMEVGRGLVGGDGMRVEENGCGFNGLKGLDGLDGFKGFEGDTKFRSCELSNACGESTSNGYHYGTNGNKENGVILNGFEESNGYHHHKLNGNMFKSNGNKSNGIMRNGYDQSNGHYKSNGNNSNGYHKSNGFMSNGNKENGFQSNTIASNGYDESNAYSKSSEMNSNGYGKSNGYYKVNGNNSNGIIMSNGCDKSNGYHHIKSNGNITNTQKSTLRNAHNEDNNISPTHETAHETTPILSPRETLKNPHTLAFLLNIIINGAVVGIIQTTLFLHLKQHLHLNPHYFGYAILLNCIFEAPTFYYSHKIQTILHGPLHMLYLALTLSITSLLFFSSLQLISTNPSTLIYLFLPFELLRGAVYALYWSAAVTHASDIAPKGLEMSAQGVLTACHWGVGCSLGSVLGGVVLQVVGGVTLYRAAALVQAVALVVPAVLLRRRRRDCV